MADFPDFMDPDEAGSRFTRRPALAILTRPGGASRFDAGDDTGDTQAVVNEALASVSEPSALGDRTVLDGTHGRGAAGWVPVVEWTAEAIGAGLIGAAAWSALARGAQQLKELVNDLRQREVQVVISRGAAALVAVAYVAETTGETGILDVEAVEEPSTIAGRVVTELSYVEIEPWLVSLLDEKRTTRYIVGVSPDGTVLGSMALPVDTAEQIYGVLPPRR